MEIYNVKPNLNIKAVIFDFDGTISVLRSGWEKVMEDFMLSILSAEKQPSDTLVNEIRQYIDESTGIQTALQMEWLDKKVKECGINANNKDIWDYKDGYNEMLIKSVNDRLYKLNSGELSRDDYVVMGSIQFLEALKNYNINMYVASGTDDADVKNEVKALGLSGYFKEVAGAPYRKKDCSKEAVIKNLIKEKNIPGESLMIIGDGKVEISLGKEAGALTLGTATDEINRSGVNPVKKERLLKAGADAITGDFIELDSVLKLMCL